MKPVFRYVLLCLLFLNTLSVAARRCTGTAGCTACSDCSQCKHCNAGGGTCGVCSYRAPDDAPSEPEDNNSYHEQHADGYELPAGNEDPSASVNTNSSSRRSTTTHTTESIGIPSFMWFLVVGVLLYLLFRRNKG